ncbi:MAG: CBS domain-containing protein [Hyphomicrobiaceae bacterium]
MLMSIGDVLALKGSNVRMIEPDETIGQLSRELMQQRIGAMVVSRDGKTIDGIISERDIAYSLADRRGELHLLKVSALMTRKVVTCTPAHSLSSVAALMSKYRIRHLPVVQEGVLVGLISIRDVLEYRIVEVERKTSLIGRLFSSNSER